MDVYADEAGYSGTNLMNADSPVLIPGGKTGGNVYPGGAYRPGNAQLQ